MANIINPYRFAAGSPSPSSDWPEISVSGVTPADDGTYKYVSFTAGSTTFSVDSLGTSSGSDVFDVLIVGGGGGGGKGYYGSGGGAGGLRRIDDWQPETTGDYVAVVGAGGAGESTGNASKITYTGSTVSGTLTDGGGGGGRGSEGADEDGTGLDGGSGGGGGAAVTDGSYIYVCYDGGVPSASDSGAFVDSSSSAHTITTNGTVEHNRAVKKVGNSSIYQANEDDSDGSGNYLTIADSSDWDITGDYTYESWFNIETMATDDGSKGIGFFSQWSSSAQQWGLLWSSELESFLVYDSSGGDTFSETGWDWSPSTDTWYHIAVVITDEGGGGWTTTLYVNGKYINSTTNLTYSASSGELFVGSFDEGPLYYYRLGGYMDEIRISTTQRYHGTNTSEWSNYLGSSGTNSWDYSSTAPSYDDDSDTVLLIHSNWHGLAFGNNGGGSCAGYGFWYSSGGGGGAGGAGGHAFYDTTRPCGSTTIGDYTGYTGGPGGVGLEYSDFESADDASSDNYYGGGGGAASSYVYSGDWEYNQGAGGDGGGGEGAETHSDTGDDGVDGTGGGGGGGSGSFSGGGYPSSTPGDGGDGIIIIRWQYQ